MGIRAEESVGLWTGRDEDLDGGGSSGRQWGKSLDDGIVSQVESRAEVGGRAGLFGAWAFWLRIACWSWRSREEEVVVGFSRWISWDWDEQRHD